MSKIIFFFLLENDKSALQLDATINQTLFEIIRRVQ